MEGLAATLGSGMNTYGDGKGNTVTHYYGGAMNQGKKKKKKATTEGKKK